MPGYKNRNKHRRPLNLPNMDIQPQDQPAKAPKKFLNMALRIFTLLIIFAISAAVFD